MAQNFQRLWGRGDWLAVTVSVVEDLNLLFIFPSLYGAPDSHPIAGVVVADIQ